MIPRSSSRCMCTGTRRSSRCRSTLMRRAWTPSWNTFFSWYSDSWDGACQAICRADDRPARFHLLGPGHGGPEQWEGSLSTSWSGESRCSTWSRSVKVAESPRLGYPYTGQFPAHRRWPRTQLSAVVRLTRLQEVTFLSWLYKATPIR